MDTTAPEGRFTTHSPPVDAITRFKDCRAEKPARETEEEGGRNEILEHALLRARRPRAGEVVPEGMRRSSTPISA